MFKKDMEQFFDDKKIMITDEMKQNVFKKIRNGKRTSFIHGGTRRTRRVAVAAAALVVAFGAVGVGAAVKNGVWEREVADRYNVDDRLQEELAKTGIVSVFEQDVYNENGAEVSSTNNGVTVRLKQTLCDSNRLIAYFEVEVDRSEGSNLYKFNGLADTELELDGKKIPDEYIVEEEYSGDTVYKDGKVKNDFWMEINMATGYDISGKQVNLKLKNLCNHTTRGLELIYAGEWNLTWTLSSDNRVFAAELKNEGSDGNYNYGTAFEGIKLERMEVTPLTLRIDYERQKITDVDMDNYPISVIMQNGDRLEVSNMNDFKNDIMISHVDSKKLIAIFPGTIIDPSQIDYVEINGEKYHPQIMGQEELAARNERLSNEYKEMKVTEDRKPPFYTTDFPKYAASSCTDAGVRMTIKKIVSNSIDTAAYIEAEFLEPTSEDLKINTMSMFYTDFTDYGSLRETFEPVKQENGKTTVGFWIRGICDEGRSSMLGKKYNIVITGLLYAPEDEDSQIIREGRWALGWKVDENTKVLTESFKPDKQGEIIDAGKTVRINISPLTCFVNFAVKGDVDLDSETHPSLDIVMKNGETYSANNVTDEEHKLEHVGGIIDGKYARIEYQFANDINVDDIDYVLLDGSKVTLEK